jgi:hypothetical protein
MISNFTVGADARPTGDLFGRLFTPLVCDGPRLAGERAARPKRSPSLAGRAASSARGGAK